MSGNLLCNRALVTAKQTEIKPKQQQIHPRTGKVDGKKKKEGKQTTTKSNHKNQYLYALSKKLRIINAMVLGALLKSIIR